MKLPLIAWIAASSCLPLWGQVQVPHDATQIGPAAGAIAAEFSLLDQFGQRRTLESLMEPQGLVLVFFRSADW
jgi:hypothetical protein